jgi:glyceraldehyde 3-phosphate dehydrogenase
MARVAINGLGRIGRATLKILLDDPEMEVVAANDLVPLENLAYLLKYDTVYGQYSKSVTVDDGHLVVGGARVPVLSEKQPERLPWKDHDIDVVFECTGLFTTGDDLRKHAQAGAKRVVLSAPAKSDDVPTVVYRANELEGDSPIVSCASCTTNCITPVMEVLDRRLGVEKATMTTVHAYTSSQQIVDGPSKKMRRGRAGAANFVPTTTGAAKATGKALPQFDGIFDGVAIRCPIPVGSIADIVCVLKGDTTAEEVNNLFREESQSDRYRGVLGVSEDPIVSSDIVGDARASIVDLEMTQVVAGNLLKVMSWYDNEWGYSAQMIRLAKSEVPQAA